ncbi:rCG54823 [Rattus norvegicus]|uniref:RCG54823 n=1 Tax=Rattus norvegicus TaxID=10116 RepID=A6IIA6_RAT|nr:rCG54823 [Rattus norvegicus]
MWSIDSPTAYVSMCSTVVIYYFISTSKTV